MKHFQANKRRDGRSGGKRDDAVGGGHLSRKVFCMRYGFNRAHHPAAEMLTIGPGQRRDIAGQRAAIAGGGAVDNAARGENASQVQHIVKAQQLDELQ